MGNRELSQPIRELSVPGQFLTGGQICTEHLQWLLIQPSINLDPTTEGEITSFLCSPRFIDLMSAVSHNIKKVVTYIRGGMQEKESNIS